MKARSSINHGLENTHMKPTRLTLAVLCLLCLTTQSGCKPARAILRALRDMVFTSTDDVARGVGHAAGTSSDDVAKVVKSKAVRVVGKTAWKEFKKTWEDAQGGTEAAQASLSRVGAHASARAVHFLRLRSEQNEAALAEDIARASEEMSESECVAATQRLERIAREQQAIARLAAEME